MNLINERTQIYMEFNEENFERLKEDCLGLLRDNEKLHKEIGYKNREISNLKEQAQYLYSELQKTNHGFMELLSWFCRCGTIHFTECMTPIPRGKSRKRRPRH